MTNKKRYSATEKIGVLEVERIFTAEFEWATRKILESDFGVDLEVEVCRGRAPGETSRPGSAAK